MGKHQSLLTLILLPLIALTFLNLLLVFTPETGFDALWYHLTLPKLWLLKHHWYFPGGLLYYSAMPRLAETVFIPLVHFSGYVGPKLLQYLSGIATSYVIWRILRQQAVSSLWSIAGVSIFYATFLVSWQSGSAYIDLFRTFLEVAALYFCLKKRFFLGGLFLGLAIGTKWHAIITTLIFSLVFGPAILPTALIVSAPWFIIAHYFTGNPVYPLFTGIGDNSFAGLSSIISHLIFSPYHLTFPYDDFLSPIIGVLFIICLLALKSKDVFLRQTSLLSVLGIFSVYTLNPPSSRYLLPYIPLLSMSSIMFIQSLKSSLIKKIFLYGILTSSVIILGARVISMKKYLPLFLGQMSSTEYLASRITYLPDTFIDTDGYVANLPSDSRLLVDKLHNLYYFPRDFDHTSWVKDRNLYDYLVTTGSPDGIDSSQLIHTNEIGIKVYKINP